MVVQGGYVSQSKGKQLSITKKSNALDKPKPNALAPKKSAKNDDDESNNNESTDNGGSDKKDTTMSLSSVSHAAAEPEVTVSYCNDFCSREIKKYYCLPSYTTRTRCIRGKTVVLKSSKMSTNQFCFFFSTGR